MHLAFFRARRLKKAGDIQCYPNVAKVIVLRRWGGETSVKQGENEADY